MSDQTPQGTAADWHHSTADAALARLASSVSGLSHHEAQARLARHGPNRLPIAARRSPLLRFLLQFHNILIYVLLGCAAVTAALRHLVDTGVVLAVVIANAIIGFIQEGKAEKAMDAIRDMLAPRANVIRNGERIGIGGEDLVPGDIVLLEAGDKVPADLRLLAAHGLSMQEAILTGESVPVEKQVAPAARDAPLGDRQCMAFSGTLVASGQGRGVVVATGSRTEIGRISGLLARVETLTTPLVAQMAVFSRWLTLLILLVAALLLAYGYVAGRHPFGDMFMAVVGLSVAAIPEGLPAVLTITLSLGVQAMARRNAIVRPACDRNPGLGVRHLHRQDRNPDTQRNGRGDGADAGTHVRARRLGVCAGRGAQAGRRAGRPVRARRARPARPCSRAVQRRRAA